VNDIDVLFSRIAGLGQDHLAREISEQLLATDVAHAVIDLDELSLVYPNPERSFARDNLHAVWPNFAKLGSLRVILPCGVPVLGSRGLSRHRLGSVTIRLVHDRATAQGQARVRSVGDV
jgi:hypothetical protein